MKSNGEKEQFIVMLVKPKANIRIVSMLQMNEEQFNGLISPKMLQNGSQCVKKYCSPVI